MSIKIHAYKPRIKQYIDGEELQSASESLYDVIWDVAVDSDGSQVDYCDGDFYFAFSDNDNYSWIPELKELLGIDVLDSFAVYFCQ